MATMNKPSSGEPDWYQAVTDNWISIENNVIDKNLWAAKGDLIAASGPSAPVRVGVGADGSLLRSDRTASPGVQWVDSNIARYDAAVLDMLWGKKFFADEGFLPSTRMFEHYGTPPAFDGQLSSNDPFYWTRNPGVASPVPWAMGWYDLGSAKSKILLVVGGFLKMTNGGEPYAFMSQSQPPDQNWQGRYSFGHSTSGPIIYRNNVRVDTDTGFDWTDFMSGFACYFDGATNTLKLFLRLSGQWFLSQSGTDSTWTSLRYVGLTTWSSQMRYVTPFVCYAE